MNNQLIVLTCLCAIISYSPQIISEWWHVHCLWGLVSFWFLCDLFVVGSDLKHANDRIKDLMTNREALDTKLKFAEIMKRINENEFLLLEIRSRVTAIQKRGVDHPRYNASTLASSSI